MGVYVVPNKSKFSNFGKDSPRVGKHLDRILQMLGGFYMPNYPFKFDVIRYTGYWFITEEACIGRLPRIFQCTL